MQIRKCVLIEMFSLVLIGMFSPFFHIIGSRIGAFGLFPFGNVLTCHVLAGHTPACARTHGRLRRAGGAAWMDPSRENFAAHGPGPRPHRPQTARREPGSCELPAGSPAPAASGNSARQKRDRQPRGCAHAGCTHRHARLPVRAWLTPAC